MEKSKLKLFSISSNTTLTCAVAQKLEKGILTRGALSMNFRSSAFAFLLFLCTIMLLTRLTPCLPLDLFLPFSAQSPSLGFSLCSYSSPSLSFLCDNKAYIGPASSL